MGIKSERLKKQLISQIEVLNADIDSTLLKCTGLQNEVSTKLKTRNQLQAKVDDIMSPKNISVTEHALLRYCERVLCIDIKTIEKNLVKELNKKKELLEKDSFNYKLQNSTFVIKNNRLVTINE